MKISVSSYSFQQYISAGKMTQLDTVEKARELGFEAIEFTDLSPCENPTYEQQKEYAFKIRERADKLKMKINAYTISANLYHPTEQENKDEVIRLKKQLDIAKILGAEVFRHDVVYTLSGARSYDAIIPQTAKNARDVSEYAKTLGIKTCTENHGYISQDSDRVERFYNAVDCDNFGLLLDMGNFLCADENPLTAYSRLAQYAIHAHAKDMAIYDDPCLPYTFPTRGGNSLRGMIIGYGDVPIKKCLRILKKAGYNGYVSIEFEGIEDCIFGIKTGLSNLKRYIKEIEEEQK